MTRQLTFIILLATSLVAISQSNTPYDAYSDGLGLVKAGQFVEAMAAFDRAYDLADPGSEFKTRSVWAKGIAYYRLAQQNRFDNDYNEAYHNFGEAMKQFRRVNREDDILSCARAMAHLNIHEFGSYDIAVEQLDYALDLSHKLNLPEKEFDLLTEKMELYTLSHDPGKRNIVSLQIDSLINANPSPAFAVNVYLKRGDDARKNGDYNVALSMFEQALDNYRKMPAPETIDLILGIYRRLRDTSQSLKDYSSALKYGRMFNDVWTEGFRDAPMARYMCYGPYHYIQVEAGDIEGAFASLDSLEKSVVVNPNIRETCMFLIEKSSLYINTKEFTKAAECMSRCDSILQLPENRIKMEDLQHIAIQLYGAALSGNRNYRRAKELFMRALETDRVRYGEESLEYAEQLHHIADMEGFLGELESGAEHYIEAWERIRNIARRDLQMLPSNARGSFWNNINTTIHNMVPYALEARFNEDRFTAAVFEALMFSKGLLLAMDKSTGRLVKDSGNEQLINDFTAIADMRNQIESLRSENKGNEIMRLYARMDSLDRILAVNMARHKITPTVTSTSAAEIIAKLQPGEAIVDFADFVKESGKHVYVACIVRPGMKGPRLVKVFEQARLDSLLETCGGRFFNLYTDDAGAEVYDIILRPLMEELQGTETLFFVPTGILYQIAVEAIPLPEGDCLSDRFNVVRLSNSNELLSYDNHRKIDNFKTARLYGGLKYDVDGDEMLAAARATPVDDLQAMRGGTENLHAAKGFEPLTMSTREVIEIDDILSQRDINVTRLMDSHGTEESFVDMSGRSPDLLLLSTHGFYYSPENVPSWSSLNGYDNPMYLTGLVMSGGNAEYLRREIPQGVMGGLLTSSDISRLDLRGTQLAALSACETALGKTTNDGVFGLQRAFKQAGVGTLVMSLWPVSDRVTMEFMTIFHREMAANGWNKRDAFNSARRTLRQKYDNPYYWAAFIMID